MKKFVLKVKESEYVVFGKDLKSAFKGEMPLIWEENKKKIKEIDISKEIKEKEEMKKLIDEYRKLISNIDVLKKEISRLKGK